MGLSLRRSQQTRSDLHRARAQDQRRGDSPPIRDSSRGNHWHANRIGNLRQESHKTRGLMLRFFRTQVGGCPPASMPWGDHGIGARILGSLRFSDGCRFRGKAKGCPCAFSSATKLGRVQSHNR